MSNQRKNFVNEVITNLSNHNLSASQFDSIRQLLVILKDFQDNGTKSNGSIDFPEFGRTIEYKLNDNKPFVRLVKTKY